MNQSMIKNNNQYLAIAKSNLRQIAVVDNEIAQNRNLLDNLIPGIELIVIDSAKDGIQQITQILREYDNIKTLHIVSSIHSREGGMNIGLSELNIHTLETYMKDLQQWRNALSNASEILLYGCLVLGESIFQNFIYQLAKITDADIGAFVTLADDPVANLPESNSYSLMVAWRS